MAFAPQPASPRKTRARFLSEARSYAAVSDQGQAEDAGEHVDNAENADTWAAAPGPRSAEHLTDGAAAGHREPPLRSRQLSAGFQGPIPPNRSGLIRVIQPGWLRRVSGGKTASGPK